MNQTNQEYTAIIAYKIGILSLIVSVIFLTFSFLGVGFTTNDDMQHELFELSDHMGVYAIANRAPEKGRIIQFIGYFLIEFPYLISRSFGYIYLNLIFLLSIFTSLALLAITVYKVTQQKFLALLVAVFFIVAIQNSWEHNVLTSYTPLMNFGIILLLSSLILFLNYISNSKKLFLVLSAITFLLALFSSYEFFFLYVGIFVFIAFYNVQITTDTSNQAAILSTLYTSSLHLIAVIVFLIAYWTFKQFYPNSYIGMEVTQPSFSNALRVIYQYIASSFPTYIYFHYSSLFNMYSDIPQGHSYTFYNFIEQLKAEWLVKSIVVSYFVYLLLHNRLIAISNKMFMGLSVVSIYAMVVPQILVSIVDRHAVWVANNVILYVTTYFSYFGTVLLIVSGIVFFNQFFYSNTLIISILRRLYVYFIIMAIAFISLVTDYSNYYVFKEQKISHQKWVVLDTFVQAGNLDSMPAGSFIYAPSLHERRGYAAINSGYWTQYLKLKYKKDVIVSSSPEEIKARFKQGVNLYYLKFSQEQKDMHQFILFSKITKIVNDIYLAADAVIVSNSNRKKFLIFGRYLPINADAPLARNAAIVVDDRVVQRDGNFFSTQVNKPQTKDKYTTTHLKLVGEAMVDVESVSISSYTDHKLYNNCFQLGFVYTANNLSCNLKSLFLTGWYGLEPWGIWSTVNAEMQINLPEDCQRTIICDLKLSLGRMFNTTDKPKKVLAKIGDRLVGEWLVAGPQNINIPLDHNILQGQTQDIKIQFFIPDAESPKQINGDLRILGIGLTSYQFIKRDINLPIKNVDQYNDCFKIGEIFTLNNLSCNLKSIFSTGWYGLKSWGIWSTANAEMQIDLPKECQDKIGCDLVLNLATGVFNSTNEKPKTVYINVENKLIGKWSGELKAINIPLSTELLNGKTQKIKIKLQIQNAESPIQAKTGQDGRILGISLKSYQIIKRGGK